MFLAHAVMTRSCKCCTCCYVANVAMLRRCNEPLENQLTSTLSCTPVFNGESLSTFLWMIEADNDVYITANCAVYYAEINL